MKKITLAVSVLAVTSFLSSNSSCTGEKIENTPVVAELTACEKIINPVEKNFVDFLIERNEQENAGLDHYYHIKAVKTQNGLDAIEVGYGDLNPGVGVVVHYKYYDCLGTPHNNEWSSTKWYNITNEETLYVVNTNGQQLAYRR